MLVVPQTQVHAVSSTDMNTAPSFVLKREKGEDGKGSYFTDATFGPCQATMCLDHVLGEACCHPSASRSQVSRVQQRVGVRVGWVVGDTC